MSVARVILRCLASPLILPLGFASLNAQEAPQAEETITLYITTVFESDTSKSNPTVYNDYFDNGRDTCLSRYVSTDVKDFLDARVEDLAITRFRIALNKPDPLPDSLRRLSYELRNTVYVNDEVTLFINYSIISLRDDEEIRSGRDKRVLKTNVLTQWDWETLRVTGGITAEADRHLQGIAETLASRVDYEILRWVIGSTSRFRVVVENFEFFGEDTAYDYLSEVVEEAVEAELSRSDAMFVFTEIGEDTVRRHIEPNYVIDGTVSCVRGQLRVDIQCIKQPANRILTSEWRVVDTLDIREISRSVAEMSQLVKRAMETDFRRSTRTLAVVGVPEPRLPSGGEANSEDISITEEIVRTVNQKLRVLAAVDTVGMTVQLLSAPTDVLVPTAYGMKPSDLLSDLNLDYLTVIHYQDLGSTVRVSVLMHAFDAERPAVASYVYENEIDRVELSEATTEIVFALLERLAEVGQAAQIEVDDLPEPTVNRLDRIKAHGVLRSRQIGLRGGGVVRRNDSELFLGHHSAWYFELFYSQMLPFLRFGFPGGTLDGGIEIVLAVDLGGDFSFKGACAATYLINYKMMLTSWQYSATSFNLAVGAGVGLQNLTYTFSPGDDRIEGDSGYRETGYVPAFDLFFQIEVPFGTKFTTDAVVRWLPRTTTITTFEDAPLTDFPEGVTGELGGVYLVGGIKYRF